MSLDRLSGPICLLLCLLAALGQASCSLLRTKPPQPTMRTVVKELPKPGTRVVVWAVEQNSIFVGEDDRQAEEEAVRWLQEHGMNLIKRSQVEQALEDQPTSIKNYSDNAALLLSAGRLAGAQQFIVLQAYADRVMVRAVNTDSGAMMWSGTGQYKDYVNEIEGRKPTVSLTRQTLEAIWRSYRR